MSKIILLEHNYRTYCNIKEMIKSGKKRIGIVQPTGTGKTYIIAKVCEEYKEKRKLFISPSNYINTQLSKVYIDDNTDIITYSWLSKLKDDELRTKEYDVIVLDEFHRCGAEIWGNYVTKLLELNKDAIIIGASATPIRFLDNARDMCDELFDGNLAINMSLTEAIAKGILKTPKYISALYSLDLLENKVRKKITKSNMDNNYKTDKLNSLDVLKKHLDKSFGASVILKKHFDIKKPKTIVFCRNLEHLNTMLEEVKNWFKDAFPNETVKEFIVHSSKSNIKNKEQLRDFEKEVGGIPVLFTIDMLNEGIHISGVTNLIFLRTTDSGNVYFQQLGRALTCGCEKATIFDFVRNAESINAFIFKQELAEVIKKESNPNYVVPDFEIYDEISDIYTLFEELEMSVTVKWDVYYDALLDFSKKNGNMCVPSKGTYTYNGLNLYLGSWINIQRRNFKEGNLAPEKIEKLKQIGFNLERNAEKDNWLYMFKKAEDYYKTNGVFYYIDCKENKSLSEWCTSQRIKYRKNKLSEEQIEKLKSIYFSFSPLEDNFKRKLDIYKLAKSQGFVFTKNNKYYEGINILDWIVDVRKAYRENKLSDKRIELLNECNFDWGRGISTWDDIYNLYFEYVKENGDSGVNKTLVYKGYALGNWVQAQKIKRTKNELSDYQINLLNEINFKWSKSNKDRWDYYFSLYKKRIRGIEISKGETEKLNKWVYLQKSAYRDKNLSKEKFTLLSGIGFDWDLREKVGYDEKWDTYYKYLLEFKKKFGNVDVPKDYTCNDLDLSEWVKRQRNELNSGKLPKSREKLLNDIGFIWNKARYDWLVNYNYLKEYYSINGHTRLTRRETFRGKNLGSWVLHQKKRFKEGKLENEQIGLLNMLNFEY